MAVGGVVPWLKVDPYFITNLTFCQEQDPGRPVSDNGCFILTHDDPSFSSPRIYNTTQQLLSWLGDPENSPFFTALPQGSAKLSIALCFKLPLDVQPCSAATTSTAWRGLVTEFFNQATSLINTLPWLQNTLEFVLDGSAAPGQKSSSCLNDLWRPWNSTYIWTLKSPPSLLEAAYLDDASKGFDRLLVLNEPEFHLPDKNLSVVVEASPDYLRFFQSIDYAKFQNGSYPVLFWEPSDQPTIQAVVDSYVDPEKASPPAAGLRFAINIDPAQFQVYSASHGFNERAPATPITSADTQIATALIPSLSGGGQQPTVATFYNDPVNTTLSYQLVQLDENAAARFQSGQVMNASLAAEITAASVVTIGSSEIIVVSDRLGNVRVLDCLSTPIFSVDSAFTLPVPAGAVDVSYSTIATAVTSDSEVLLFHASISSPNVVFLVVYSLSNAQGSWSLSPLGFTTSISAPSSSQLTSLAFSIASSPEDSQRFSGLILAGNKEVRPTVLIFSAEYVIDVAIGLGLTPAYLLGEHPSISIRLDPCTNELAVLAAVGESYCFNSETHNKRASVAVCDQEPESTPRILNYYFGRFSSVSSTIGLVTSCTPTVTAGAYDQGNMPSVLLLPKKPAFSNAFVPCLSVFEAHQTAFEMDAPLAYVLLAFLCLGATAFALTPYLISSQPSLLSSTQECGLASNGNANSLIFDSWVLAYSIDR